MSEARTQENIALAVLAASALISADALPDSLDGRAVQDGGTPVFDINGELLFHRVAFAGEGPGYIDVGVHPALGTVMVAVSPEARWYPDGLIEGASAHLGRSKSGYDEARFVAYSFPKLAVQFLRDGREVALLELHTWADVPDLRDREKNEPPAQFERWSYIDSLSPRTRAARAKSLETEANGLRELSSRVGIDSLTIARYDALREFLSLVRTRELHYSRRAGDHGRCFELRGQQTNVWCVAASVQMVLDFYRYEYSQTRIARDLGLGTLSNPNGLPYADDALVVTVLEALTRDALNATMYTTSPFSRFRTQIDANRPLVSFVPGHSRAVAGYAEVLFEFLVFSFTYRGLLVLDPWPPNAGVITRWENFATQTYRRTFTASLTMA
jgi:hypothetical protein